jgi:peptidoglycan/LPS O-acetylase OafA/YrhL
LIGNADYRSDIDGLRGISILAVLGFHFVPTAFKGGFVGVDVFFVISGFLITGILIDGISIKEFYIRRAKRLLPALCIALVIALALGFVLLLPDEFRLLGRNILAAATFTTNFVLINDHSASGYFTNLAENNQLTHLWSLSIEEQYYLLWPLAFRLISKRCRLFVTTCILLLFVVSDFCNVWGLAADRYYFPGTRFWEILAGSWLAIAQRDVKPRWESYAGLAKLCGLSLIAFAIFALHPDDGWPGPKALVPVGGAMLVLTFRAQRTLAGRLISNPVLVWFGLISYPLYLYHWILLAFAQQAYLGQLPGGMKVVPLVSSVALAALTYRYVEIPIRRGEYGMPRFALLPASLAAVFFVSLGVFLSGGLYWRHADYVAFNDAKVVGEDGRITESCLKKFGDLFPNRGKRYFCEDSGDSPHPVLIFGDSHAAMLYQGFLSLNVINVAHLGKGSCAPIWNLEPADPWYQCQPEVNGFIEYATSADSPLIILTGVFERYFDGEYGIDKPASEIEHDIQQWFEVLSRSKSRIVLVLDNPALPFEPKECMKRPIDLRRREDCSFDRSVYDKKAAYYKQLFNREAWRASNVLLLDASKFFCDANRCNAVNDQGLLYTADNNHLSRRGAAIVDRQILEMFPLAFRVQTTLR